MGDSTTTMDYRLFAADGRAVFSRYFLKAFGAQHTMTERERAARVHELQRQKTAVEQELRQLRSMPECTALSTVPPSEMENQPTRTQKESLESVPGVAVRPGGNVRMLELTIR